MKSWARVLILLLFTVLLCTVAPVRAERAPGIRAPAVSYAGPPPPGWPTDSQSTSGPVAPPQAARAAVNPSAASTQVVLTDVPAYIWYRGCGPTSAGMVIGYWDGKGFDNLVSGSAATQTAAVNAMMSSSGNYNDYYLPDDTYTALQPDKSEPPPGDEHANDSVADLMKTSQSHSYNKAGWSWWSDMPIALVGWVQMVAPQYSATAVNQYWGTFTWEGYKAEINAGRPVVLLVDSNGDGSTDHFVAAMGYSDDGVNRLYAARNTWDYSVHWYAFTPMAYGVPFGIYGATLFRIQTVLPAAFGKTSPSNASWGQGTSPSLSWTSSSGATSYEYCYDTTNNGTCDGGWNSTTSTTVNLAGLPMNTTFRWQVRARNAAGTTDADNGAWWSFGTGLPPPVYLPLMNKQ